MFYRPLPVKQSFLQNMYHPRQVLSEFSYLVDYLVSKQNKEKSSVYYVETNSLAFFL